MPGQTYATARTHSTGDRPGLGYSNPMTRMQNEMVHARRIIIDKSKLSPPTKYKYS